MQFFFHYLKCKWKVLTVFALFGVLFLITFYLYELPLAAVLYPLLLCVAAGGIVLFLNFRKAKQYHGELLRIRQFALPQAEDLPETGEVFSEEYGKIILMLCDAVEQNQAEAELRYADTVEYFTLWAHQIKTPIAAMKLKLQNEDNALSRQMNNELVRIEQYVEMVLTFLRLKSDSTDYCFRQCNADDLVRSCVKKFAGEFIDRRLKLDFKPSNLTLLTDEKWFGFVLEQVLSNALKYTPKGTVSIFAQGNVLCVQDTGIGIAPEDLPRIFEKGYTGFNGRRDTKASGIGLYLCRQICGNLGIGISAFSVVGEGTVIRLDLSQKHIDVR